MGAGGRLKPGASIAQASAELDAIYQHRYHPKGRQPGQRDYMLAVPFARGLSPLGSEYSKPLAILMGAVGLVLIIACVMLLDMVSERLRHRLLAMERTS